ncbi:hypothetical protein ASPWEDRAFT_45161 [Aspergillus wentii DTO 134E9]|uniref:Uncharacterized protein n=1 Tax=Aspergillus wentii DTO 134E9 TaxID=1073089 RepID=A0A1L9R8H9_ASPWE|nr:uncharacterized protein ASPWEDRAFT_45161 [Aspergillus wentii DTO 134E9]KAI9925031.1 hypothetical protein MW887_006438 [Aspergillus wentii]OJJ31204.1 hypothetical protein ASPWEDRAFT_45161 [Aspergillus wentii DTO 134E9]
MPEDTEKRGTTSNNPNPSQSKQQPETPNSSSTTNDNDSKSPSLASRIQNSAAGLARNALTTPGPSGDLAYALSTGNKAAATGSSSASSAPSTADYYAQSSTSSRAQSGSSIPAESFRSESAQHQQQGGFELPPLTEEEFQHVYDGDNTLHDVSSEGKGKGKAVDLTHTDYSEKYHDTAPSAFSTAWQHSSQPHRQQHQQPQPQPSDGSEVISLLTSKSFNPDFPPSADEPFEPIETDLLPQPLTPAEIQMIESFRRQLPAEPDTSTQQPQTHRLTSFSLVPDINSILDGAAPVSTESDATALRDAVLTGLPGAAEWVAVEERYHDEVWGYLRPTLEAAKEEMETKQESGEGGVEDGPAVRRLKMILQHMKA